MINQAGKSGISALMVMGDLPAHPALENLDFLVQFNMFVTDTSDHADVLFPVTDFLETEGHVLSMEGKTKRVNKAISRPHNVKTIAGIVSGLAKVMEESGFTQKPAEIFRELRPLIENPAHFKPADRESKINGSGSERPEEHNGYPVRLNLHHNHYRYRGNRLIELVEDLRSVSPEGMIGLPDSLMVKLKVKEGDKVRIFSEHGKLETVVRSNPGQNCQSACLFTNSNETFSIQGKLYPDNMTVNVKIEKV
jgi:predicted molibdopterin-dependent oxidoreductase YjgC